jgi:exosome complex component RRP42
MASSQHVLLSPAELAYLHASLSLTPPIRPDGRSPTQFRPLVAETGILPGTNGSARICFADGTEAIVGVKAEVERTAQRPGDDTVFLEEGGAGGDDDDEEEGETAEGLDKRKGEASWVEMTVEIPGLRDDDSGTAFLAAMLSEALLADGEFVKRLWINRRFHWKLYLDVRLLLSSNHPFPVD